MGRIPPGRLRLPGVESGRSASAGHPLTVTPVGRTIRLAISLRGDRHGEVFQ